MLVPCGPTYSMVHLLISCMEIEKRWVKEVHQTFLIYITRLVKSVLWDICKNNLYIFSLPSLYFIFYFSFWHIDKEITRQNNINYTRENKVIFWAPHFYILVLHIDCLKVNVVMIAIHMMTINLSPLILQVFILHLEIPSLIMCLLIG
jgi:hypothetical protein